MAKPAVRLGAVQLVFVLGAALALARLVQVQLVDGDRYRARSASQRTKHVDLPARRGAIYDRLGMTLARTQETFHVEIAANELLDVGRDTKLIARHLGLRERTVRNAVAKGRAYFHGPFPAVRVQPLRAIRGVHLSSELVRFHPDPGFAQPFLGWPERAGRPASGLERVLDTLLAGKPGHAVVLRDGRGRRYESPARLDAFPVAGHDVYLTLDGGLQEIVEDELALALDRYEAMSGDVVVLNPQTGELLAIASRTRKGGRTPNALTGVFEPGSTAKPFVAAALLERRLAALDDPIWTEQGTYVTGGRTIRDDHAEGWLTLAGVIGRSSNIGIAKFAERLTSVEQFEVLRSFGFGSPTGVEYPSESAGILHRPHRWSRLTAASLAMGYEMAVTPLQLAQAYGAIANDGLLVRPALVLRVSRPGGGVVYEHTPEPVRRVMSPATARDVRTALRGVVSRGGTGETAALTTYEVSGKTGTAYRAGPQGYVSGDYTASFVSLFPADRPQLVMVVKLDRPRDAYARLTAAPLTRVVLERVLAAQTGALDWARLSEPAARMREPERMPQAAPLQVVAWPVQAESEPVSERSVPDLTGVSLRQAARQLHALGLRVTVTGWGLVRETKPASGVRVAPGTLVHVVARPQP